MVVGVMNAMKKMIKSHKFISQTEPIRQLNM